MVTSASEDAAACPFTKNRDACGVGFVVDIRGKRSHEILVEAERMLVHMDHRGGCTCDSGDDGPRSGDGAGVLTAIPHKLLKKYFLDHLMCEDDIPKPGEYACGMMFVDADKIKAKPAMDLFEELAEYCQCNVLLWRDVPTCNKKIGKLAFDSEPAVVQVFLTSNLPKDAFIKQIYMLRKMATHRISQDHGRFYMCSLSTETIVYKGLFTADQVAPYYLDLEDEDYETHFAIVHSRYSTNTNPSWERAHPQRLLAHNGEINTIQGNVKNMIAREGNMQSAYYGDQLPNLFPVIEKGLSDSGCVDNVLEFLTVAGDRSLPEAVMTLVPEAWQDHQAMKKDRKDFYKWASCSLEPWDGPALFTFSDGQFIGAILDRNGLRPSRYYLTSAGRMIMASEVGVSSVEPENVIYKGRLMPGRMLLVDTKKGAVIRDEELKNSLATLRPVSSWLADNMLTLADFYEAHIAQFGEAPNVISRNRTSSQLGGRSVETDRRMPLFGYSVEDINMLLVPMIRDGKEALGSMGNDSPLACLTMYPHLVFDYFKQMFAQVTNPPIDPFRERIVMSLACPIGPEADLLNPSEKQCQRVYLDSPVLSPADLAVLTQTKLKKWKTQTIDIIYPASHSVNGLVPALDKVCSAAEDAIMDGHSFVLLSDRKAGNEFVPISSLLAVGAVHQYLVQKKLRKKVGIILESADPREIHHLCTLFGFGADAVCPYLVFETFSKLAESGLLEPALSDDEIVNNYKKAADIGIRKVMAKMGISTLHSYKGAQIFEAVGLASEVMDKCFTGTASRIGGVTFEILAQEALDRHRLAFSERDCDNVLMNNPGAYHWRDGGEKHVNDPRSIAHLQNATRNGNTDAYMKYVKSTMETIAACTLRGQLGFVFSGTEIPLEEVEDAAEIVKRFCTGAMSFGSISEETHKTLAVAMNKMGGKSNSGEGGEDPARYDINVLGKNERSAIKQIASGRFGVTSRYLANADDLQIKMAQGAKPGEGGELPGYKVTEKIAETRHSVPGVSLISPPPHHDIYSIEDLSQLIYDLKCANPEARISVKLVSEVGVGVIASGVAKGLAEHIVISGHDGGTGASSWTGVKHAGLPWELGLSETHQTLIKNKLRQKVKIQVDGQMRTGHDVMTAAMLGADEFGFSTAPLIALGCTMMRKCHLNTCPVGIATQDPVLRAKFDGKPEYVINYFFMIAEEIRLLLSKLGVRTLQEVIGRTEFLEPLVERRNAKTKLLDFSQILQQPSDVSVSEIVGGSETQAYRLEDRKDNLLIEKSRAVIDGCQSKVQIDVDVENIDRTFGTMLSYAVSKAHPNGLPHRSIHIKANGAGGQSFGAFLARGITLELEGDANDYVGKGLSGGEIVIYPSEKHGSSFQPEENIIIGNVCLYGATSGKAFFNGIAAERFCVRNSGAVAVVEGCGDHGCEYMTGGVAIILGQTGRNFAAGMSGGIAFIYDSKQDFSLKCNTQMVSLVPPTENDLSILQNTIQEHVQLTGSPLGLRILENWSVACKKFVKVFPNDYQRIAAAKSVPVPVKDTLSEEQSNSDNSGSASDSSPPHSPPTKREKHDSSGIVDIEDSIPNVEQEKQFIEKVLDKTRGFINYSRSHNSYRLAKKRMKDWGEIYNKKNKKELKVQAARCMDCGVPFCQSHTGCPLGNVIPKWNDLVFHNKWKEALDRLLQTNNFPEFTGRACPAPCESACVLSINAEPVTIKNIECAIIDRAFDEGWMKPQIPAHRTGKKVAVIGSGPAGLAAAAQLNKAGHLVTVMERNDRCGGLLMYGIPSMKLSKKTVQRRIDLMAQEGIIFKTNCDVGGNIEASAICDEFDAVLLATGSTWPRDLPVPGRQLNGIHLAMEFLELSQKNQMSQYPLPHLNVKDKDVIIIGGGDTGVDCIGTSLRMDAKSITTFEILKEPPKSRSQFHPWPVLPRVFRVEYGHEEVAVKYGKDPRVYNIMCKEFLDDGRGNVCGVKAVEIGWAKDTSSRWFMHEIEGSEKIFKADVVILALGFLGPEKTISKLLGVERDIRSNFATPKGKFNTNVDKVYAAGDCHYGQSLIVTAIAEGRQAARQIDLDLMGSTSLAGPGGLVQPPRRQPRQVEI